MSFAQTELPESLVVSMHTKQVYTIREEIIFKILSESYPDNWYPDITIREFVNECLEPCFKSSE